MIYWLCAVGIFLNIAGMLTKDSVSIICGTMYVIAAAISYSIQRKSP